MNPPTDQTLLTLVMPPALSDLVADWLLEQGDVSGFVSLPVNGHGGEEHSMTEAEKVAGYTKGWMIQTHLPETDARALLDRLKADFAGSGIHYWITPVSGVGRL